LRRSRGPAGRNLIRIQPGIESPSDAVQTVLLTHMDHAPQLQDQDLKMQAAIE
jgi:hypothetical protein